MAFTSSGVVEIRDTGAAVNGGYYNSAVVGATTDYSQQDTAQLTIADGDCNNSTTLTSVTGGFTAAMIGNAMHIVGAGFTTGWYEIRTRVDTNTITLDRNPTGGGHPTTGSCVVGGALTDLPGIAATLTGDYAIHIKKGSYTWGAFTLPVVSNGYGNPFTSKWVAGYKTIRNDKPTGADRPAITQTATLTTNSNMMLRDLIITGNFNGALVSCGTFNNIINCKISQTNATANLSAVVNASGAYGALVGCEIICTNGYAINCFYYVQSCYIHDSVTGWLFNTVVESGMIENSVIDTCSTDAINATKHCRIANCTIYGCAADAIHVDQRATIVNCIVSGNANGVRMNTSFTVVGRNNVFNNTTNFPSNSYVADSSDLLADPLLTDPANGNFTLTSLSPARGLAQQVGAPVGVTGTYNATSGVYQFPGFTGQIMSVG